jgi:TolB protein
MMHFVVSRTVLTVLVVGVQLSLLSLASPGQSGNDPQHLSVKKIAFEAGWEHGADADYGTSQAESAAMGTQPLRASIYVRDPVEAKARSVAEGAYPTWSPDGSQLAYCAVDGAFYGQIHIVDANGKGNHQFTHLGSGACFPEWSPDGKEMVVTLTTGVSSKLAIVDENGTLVRELGEGKMAHWSPSGKVLVFIRPLPRIQVGYSIWMISADGSKEKEVLEDHSPELEANWLPNGTGILFSSKRDGLAAVYTVGLDGKNVRKLGADPLMNWFEPVMSPDGKSLIVDAVTPPTAPLSRIGVMQINADSHRATMLTVGNHYSVFWGKAAEPKAQKDSAPGH